MDTKRPLPPSSPDTELPPPSYSEIGSSNSIANSYYSDQINSQLAALTTQISTQHTQHAILFQANSERVLSSLTSEILNYLSTFARSRCSTGALLLVPAAGITHDAVPVDLDFTHESSGTYNIVSRIVSKDNPGDLWYWKDEDMAEKLAAQLRPPPPPPSERELPPRPEEVAQQQQAQQSTRGFWGRKKSATKSKTASPVYENAKRAVQAPLEDKVIMDIKAEEVVFRTENDFGIYETERGMGIVVRLKVVQGRR